MAPSAESTPTPPPSATVTIGFEMSVTVGWMPNDPDGENATRPGSATAGTRSRPYGDGVYANFISDEGDAGLESAYGDRLKRLTALKDAHDPDNFFSMNANIAPSASSYCGGERTSSRSHRQPHGGRHG